MKSEDLTPESESAWESEFAPAALATRRLAIYDRFESAWECDLIPRIQDYLPSELPSAEQRQVLLELVLIDLERRWKRFHKCEGMTSQVASSKDVPPLHEIPPCPLLEDYCRQYPELGAVEQLPMHAIGHEFQMRCRVGNRPAIDEYTRRFPSRIAELTKIFATVGSNPKGSAVDTGAIRQSAETCLEALRPIEQSPPTSPIEDDVEITSLRDPVPELANGQTFGRYRIESVLGHGGMGAVYRAYDSHLHRTVALKVPSFKQGHSEEIVKRFLREARAVAQLSHTNLCRVFDVGVIDGTLFLTMELVEGKSLEQLFKPNEPLPEADVVPLVRQMALALQEAHERGIVHRDLKPANIMLNAKGQPILMDFGLARLIDNQEHDLTGDGALLGTPAYMSPEQVRGESRDVGPATDIYSLGVVMYRLLTGRRPFEGTFMAMLSAIPTKIPTSPREIRPAIHPAIEAICMKALAKSPSDRFASAAEMAAALDRAFQILDEHSDKTILPIAKPSERKALGQEIGNVTLWRNGRVRGIAGAVAAGVLIAVVAWSIRGQNPSSAENASTRGPSPVANGDEPSAVSAGDSAPLSTALDIAAIAKANGKSIAADPILETHVQRAAQNIGFEVLSKKSLPLRTDDKLQFHVWLNSPSYVYLYLIDSHGVPKRLWPETAEALSQQKPVTELWAPPLAAEGQKQTMYFLNNQQGQETVLVATSHRPLSQADLQTVETVRLNLAHGYGDKRQLVSFRRDDRERGFGGLVETDKALSVELESFTERLGKVFDSYTGIVFPHE